MAAAQRPIAYTGPALLSGGFRPFFFLGSIWAGLEVIAWLPMFHGELSLATAFSPRDWHVHELLFGYVPAIVAGFLLTAIPNWTGRPPLRGAPLAGLVIAWAAGRAAVTVSATIGWQAAMTIDATFLALMAGAAAREIVAAKNWRNLKIVVLLGLLTADNVAFHLEAHREGLASHATRLGIAVVIAMIMLVGGRIIPSFTLNWLMRQPAGRKPTPFDALDEKCAFFSICTLALWVAVPDELPTGLMMFGAALFNAARLARWAGERTFSDRLVLVLHVGYAFVPLGFLLGGLAAFGAVTPGAGMHAWTVGAIGTMTLAVMSRASLGHTGRPLIASPGLQAVYLAVVAAAAARLCAELHPSWQNALLHVAAAGWAMAFLGFALLYSRILCASARPTRLTVAPR
jgi:uncharacterized protein involved in response to NO